MGLHLMGSKSMSLLAGKCSHPYWVIVSTAVPETKQFESWSCSSWIGTDTHISTWVSYPTLSSGPSARAEEAKVMPRLPSTASCFCPRSQSKSFHVFAAFCILLFFYSRPFFPSFSNYLPNKGHSLIDTSTETPKAQERNRCKVHEPEVCIRWLCSCGRNYPLLLQCVCLHILRSTKPAG